MARGTIDSYRADDARVTIEFDTGGPVGSSHVVFVSGGDEVDDTEWQVTRWFYFGEWNEQYARNFAEKVATNESYREESINRTADWARVADTYETAAREIFEYFSSAGVMSYRMGDDEAEKEYRNANETMEQICKELFNGVKSRIRSPESVGEDEPPIDEFIGEKKREAKDWLQSNGYELEY